MSPTLHHLPSWRTRGFSLVEVAMAIAVAGIALMSVVGLMPGLLDAERDSNINSVLPSLTSQAIEELRARPYQPPPRMLVLHFSENGALLKDAAGALYRCTATLAPITSGAPDVPGRPRSPDPGTYCSVVTLEFTWPSPQSSRFNRRVVHASLPQP